MKVRELTIENTFLPPPDKFVRCQWKRGWALSTVGLFVYGFLRLIGRKPKDFHGICRYFEIGKNWGGLEMGWFFIVCKNASETLKMHELGHGVFNANVGGLRTLMYSTGSACRYWYRRIFRVTKTPYDAWWYEGYATAVGMKYVRECSAEKPVVGDHRKTSTQ